MGVVISLGIIILMSVFIYYIGNIFARSSSKIGDYFHLPRAVKGATFDAIASSLPELFEFLGIFGIIILVVVIVPLLLLVSLVALPFTSSAFFVYFMTQISDYIIGEIT